MPLSDDEDDDASVPAGTAVGSPPGLWAALPEALVVLGWVIVAVLAWFALLRMVVWDSLEPLIVVNALTMVVYLPAWIVAIGAALVRQWLLMGAALIIVAAQIAFVLPELTAASPLPPWTRNAPLVRVFDANINKVPFFASGYVHAIESYRPDVMSFEEFSPGALDGMTASGVLRAYPYRCSYPAPEATGLFVASRWRLSDCQLHTVAVSYVSKPYMVEATLSTPAGPVALRVVHTLAPLPLMSEEWKLALSAVDHSIRRSGTNRMLMTGDFNATWGNRGFVTLLGDGLTDGAAARGQALDMTWPDGAPVPPFVRIDHVLTGANLAVVKIASGSGFGRRSHHYLTAEVAVRP
jgi:endonuclease/exonuclease/phosphatase (EEP) superfamily protein YafD